jgi:SAM-dependent methyltransferase
VTHRPSGDESPRFNSASGQQPGRVDYDTELQRHNEVLRVAIDVRLHDRVLDIGCGAGQTSREAARAAEAGSVLGVDVSAPAIERARDIARAEQLRNVTFEHANAQLHAFPQDHFDLAISRFGTMFFDEPVDAFANVRRALRPAGRLTMMVWQAREHNEWAVAVHRAVAADDGSAQPASDGPNAFSLADPTTVTSILEAAGYAEVAFTDVDQPVYYGPDVAAAYDWVTSFATVAEVLDRLDAAAAKRAVERLLEALAAHASETGVWFNSRAWIVSARRH